MYFDFVYEISEDTWEIPPRLFAVLYLMLPSPPVHEIEVHLISMSVFSFDIRLRNSYSGKNREHIQCFLFKEIQNTNTPMKTTIRMRNNERDETSTSNDANFENLVIRSKESSTKLLKQYSSISRLIAEFLFRLPAGWWFCFLVAFNRAGVSAGFWFCDFLLFLMLFSNICKKGTSS